MEGIAGREKIFVQIAAYRDPELLPTLRDCIYKAHKPDNLVFSIAHQCSKADTWDTLDEFKNYRNFKVIEIPHERSEGACWARNLLQQQYAGEEYTLQLDSHHRFVPGWDTKLIAMLRALRGMGSKKPLLTAYLPAYNPPECVVPSNLFTYKLDSSTPIHPEIDGYIEREETMSGRTHEPHWLTFHRYIPEGAIFTLPSNIPGYKDMVIPLGSRYYSGHFCFTDGAFSKDVQHDPNLYFHGEEITIAARAYTHGYDLYAPNTLIAWHEYTRKGRVKHWDENPNWGYRNAISHKRVRVIFGMDGEDPNSIDFGKYGLGTERTLHQYERYAGIYFSERAVTKTNYANEFLPEPYYDDNTWRSNLLHVFNHYVDLGFEQVPEDDYTFWAVAFEDVNGVELARIDADVEEIARLRSDPDGYIKLNRTFHTKVKPHRWIVWPYSASKGFCERLTGII